MSESRWVTVLSVLLVGNLFDVGWNIVRGHPTDAVFAWFAAGAAFYVLRAHANKSATVRGKSFVQRER